MTDYDRDTDAYHRWSVADSPYWLIERTRYFEVLGSVQNLNILELACGEGRISRMLMERGARSVVASDVSGEMIKRAEEQNRDESGEPIYPELSFAVVDACDEAFTLDPPVDLVTAFYLFHYASSDAALRQMCRHISRNLKPGGRFVAYTVNPDFDITNPNPRMAEDFGFRYVPVDPPHYHLVFRGLSVNMWHWSKAAHEAALHSAGLKNVRWHALCPPADRPDLLQSLKWYLDDPSCTVVSAENPG